MPIFANRSFRRGMEFALTKAMAARRLPVKTGVQGMIGKKAEVRGPALVFVDGALWNAHADDDSVVTALRGAVAQADIKSLSKISGVGRKTAERIVVELKDKVGPAGAWEAVSAQRALSPEDQKVNDAVLALLALGFKQPEAHEAVRAVAGTLGEKATVEDLVRACLKKKG